MSTKPKITATEISAADFEKGNRFTEDRRLLVLFGETDHRGKPLVKFNTFLGYEATMPPADVSALAAMLDWVKERATDPAEYIGARIALSVSR